MTAPQLRRPEMVVSADWSTNDSKRWMTRAELQDDRRMYRVLPPERVGNASTLLDRLVAALPQRSTLLLGFDFPIGLPRTYAETAGLSAGGFRSALDKFGRGERWGAFYDVSDRPNIHQPFYPPPSQVK